MKISSITDIVEGELLNSPSISFVYHIKTNPKRVNEGDLFIAKNSKDLQLAINHGAFGVIIDFDVEISDNEIAWIKVASYEKALTRLFRFHFSHFNLKVYSCDKITYELLFIYRTLNKNLRFLKSKLENSIEIIEHVSKDDILISCDKKLLDDIYPNNLNFNQKKYSINNLIEHSIFETSFSYSDIYFSKIKIPSLYLQQLLSVYEFFNKTIDFNKLKKFSCFKPIFIDRFINIIEFGKSDKFLIVQKDYTLVTQEIAYIKNHYTYAKAIYITNTYSEDLNAEQIVIKDIKILKEVLRNNRFNCAYIIGFDFTDVEKNLVKSNQELTLL